MAQLEAVPRPLKLLAHGDHEPGWVSWSCRGTRRVRGVMMVGSSTLFLAF